MVSKKRQQSGIIDCTCTIASISSVSRFACAIVWLVGVITRICFAFVNICQKRREEEKRIKMGFGFHSGAIHVHVWKPRTLVGNFLVSCDSLVEPVSQTVILNIFHVGTANIPKAYSINCSYFATGAKNTIYKQRNKERTKRNHPLLRQREWRRANASNISFKMWTVANLRY